MQLLDDYFKLQEYRYKYFGFVEDWVVLPLDDSRERYWMITKDDTIIHSLSKEDVLNDTGNYCEDYIYKQRFYKKWVYRGDDFTMIMIDTRTYGNRFLSIFDNAKEIREL